MPVLPHIPSNRSSAPASSALLVASRARAFLQEPARRLPTKTMVLGRQTVRLICLGSARANEIVGERQAGFTMCLDSLLDRPQSCY